MQAILSAFGLFMLLLTMVFLPETSHPGARGVDKLIEAEGRPRWVWLNPFGCLSLLRSPNIILLVSDILLANMTATVGNADGRQPRAHSFY